MIEAYESGRAPAFELYALGLEHKHMPEIERYSGLTRRPIFMPSVGNFRQGMLVSVPLHLDALPANRSGDDLRAAFEKHYRGQGYFHIGQSSDGSARIEPEVAQRDQRHRNPCLRQRGAPAGACWSPSSTISARARPARRCRT